MAILKIAKMGHPLLRRRADLVDDPTAAEIGRLIDDMWETLDASCGIGLAAPQVHVPLRIIVFSVPLQRLQTEDGAFEPHIPPTVVINPVVMPLDETMVADWEACLSIPGLTGRVKRWVRIRYAGFGSDGLPIDRVAEGLHARVVQHECDHLDGILYPHRIEDFREFGFADELRAPAPSAIPSRGTAIDAAMAESQR